LITPQARFIDGKPDTGNGTLRGATGTTPWTLYEFELPIDKTASNINFGVLSSYAMKVELDGQPYSNPQIDFDFESPNAKGFYICHKWQNSRLPHERNCPNNLSPNRTSGGIP
jgi:hypothetical protein